MNEISELIDLNKKGKTKAEFANQIYGWFRGEIQKALEKVGTPYNSVDIEKALKVLFLNYSLLMLNILTLEIPNILIFNCS